MTGVEEADLLLLIGTNPKTESPVFNSRILRAVRHNNLKVALIGSAADLSYDYLHLGNSAKTLQEISEGKHPFSARLAKAKLPMIIVGSKTVERQDGKAILNAISKISQNTSVINKANGWNGFNILHRDVGRIAALEVGLNSINISQKKPKFVFILGADNIRTEDIPSDAFVVYLV